MTRDELLAANPGTGWTKENLNRRETAVAVGYSGGYAHDEPPYDPIAFAGAFFGQDRIERTGALYQLVSSACRLTSATRWWIRLKSGTVISGFRDGSGLRARRRGK